MEERTETVTRRRRQSGLWGKICGAFGTSDWGWETYKEDVEPQCYQYQHRQEGSYVTDRHISGSCRHPLSRILTSPSAVKSMPFLRIQGES